MRIEFANGANFITARQDNGTVEIRCQYRLTNSRDRVAGCIHGAPRRPYSNSQVFQAVLSQPVIANLFEVYAGCLDRSPDIHSPFQCSNGLPSGHWHARGLVLCQAQTSWSLVHPPAGSWRSLYLHGKRGSAARNPASLQH